MQGQAVSHDPKVPVRDDAVAALGHVRGDAVVGLGDERGDGAAGDGGAEEEDDVGCAAFGAPADGAGGVAGVEEVAGRSGFGAGVAGWDVEETVVKEGGWS